MYADILALTLMPAIVSSITTKMISSCFLHLLDTPGSNCRPTLHGDLASAAPMLHHLSSEKGAGHFMGRFLARSRASFHNVSNDSVRNTCLLFDSTIKFAKSVVNWVWIFHGGVTDRVDHS